ncbi:rhodanese-like domain-containing protein [Kingella negevensis]|uniref:Thiosulfate sulfurtransferase PspE n=1 Tax=Kingella negevensis TaxID=1522312 RepID=A0A238HE72_9NEIS|nr:rhodanese-like domain-containing protein [Kingella negevensis]MDK4681025.1 rhodanese-like domain-containing protein [Kingella negevensis]MDK4683227.1 rhodanese-like domain-containing protein [Kingella negevensis]MDK4683899.1 rhodanese-like domain-containing protein [Kingella negevensis]MDK4688086.1 rhodanese-like domain-containing protein [Kingella negevensis]MDK4691641.1 rhodanese-like domain-containing protein [Kingella negevensis]
MNKLLISVLLVCGLTACAELQNHSAASAVASQTAQTQTQPEKAAGVWIDVRTPEEFQSGHIQDAINIPVEQIATQIANVSKDKSAPINLYCRTGRRAEVALNTLKNMGYTNVTNHGGYQDLVKKGIK